MNIDSKKIQEIKTILSELDVCISRLKNIEIPWNLKCLLSAYDLVINKYAPFKVGDRVKLLRSVEVDQDSGWWQCKHFLIKDAVATVREVHVNSEGKLGFQLEFDNESFIDANNDEIMVHPKNRHLFNFGESILAKTDQ